MTDGWGLAGAVLGSWELAAILTGRVPTVSRTVCGLRGRWPAFTTAVVVGWAAGTTAHLLTYRP